MSVAPSREASLWGLGAVVVALVVAVPIVSVAMTALGPSGSAWEHLVQTRLGEYTRNSVVLALFATSAAVVLGVAPAWLLAAFRFPGRSALTWAMLLPLAVPPYLAAYAFTDLTSAGGAVPGAVRGLLGEQAAGWVPSMRTRAGASTILAFALSPYVFFAAHQAFLAHGLRSLEVARTLGRPPWRAFFTVSLPLALPAIIGGGSLVMMETIADFGVADYCAVDTLATGVYRAWLGLDSPPTAARISLVLLLVVLAVLSGAHVARSKFATAHAASTRAAPKRLRGWRTFAAFGVCALPVVGGFVLPVVALVGLALRDVPKDGATRILEYALNSLLLGVLAAVSAGGLAVVVVYGRRVSGGVCSRLALQATRFGYAVPGTVIAVGLLIPLTSADRGLNAVVGNWFGEDARPGLLLTGSIAAIVLGCQSRFLAVAATSVQTSFERVRSSLDGAARTLGAGPTKTLLRVHLPICRAGLAAACLLVFADVIKELPMTLLLRPFDFDTLAVRSYQFASEERLSEAALPGLGLIALGLVPVCTLSLLKPALGRGDR